MRRASSVTDLLAHGQKLFAAAWTVQEGAGRPLTTGTGVPLADTMSPLTFPRNFNRLSAPDANACSGCHNQPFGIAGGSGDMVANVFVLAQRFDFAEPGRTATARMAAAVDERGQALTFDNLGNSRATTGMFGAGTWKCLRVRSRSTCVLHQQRRPALYFWYAAGPRRAVRTDRAEELDRYLDLMQRRVVEGQ